MACKNHVATTENQKLLLAKCFILITLWTKLMMINIDNNHHRCCTALTFGPPATLG